MKQDPFRSDLRVCTPGEPKSELVIFGSDVQKIDETGNVLSKIESQGPVLRKGFGLELFGTDADSSGKWLSEPEGRFVP